MTILAGIKHLRCIDGLRGPFTLQRARLFFIPMNGIERE